MSEPLSYQAIVNLRAERDKLAAEVAQLRAENERLNADKGIESTRQGGRWEY